ncbi:hypothetical protein BKA64DRAFT_143624 [Cadophora sp. MPI-SDFR-AT-0126]|nr:hypothetical protein BKA64DRAFT_143624 [Leotiomycetes sp. MPI-SDFR-AT-0126]
MDSRESISQSCGISQMSSLGSSSQFPSSFSLAQYITHNNQEQLIAHPKIQSNLNNNSNNHPLHPTSGVAVAVSPFSVPPVPVAAPMTSEHSPTHVPCHNCRTLGQSDCNTVQRDTACNRCLLMGMDCDLDLDLLTRERGEVKWCGYCGMSGKNCMGNPDGCRQCLNCCEGECRRGLEGGLNKFGPVDEKAHEHETSSVVLGGGDAAKDTSTVSIAVRCQGCGERLDTAEDVQCSRCRDVMLKTMQGFPRFVRSNHPAHDGKVLNTCAGCFEPKLDPQAAEIYCSGCKASFLRSVWREKNAMGDDETYLGHSVEPIEDSKASTFGYAWKTNFADRTGAHPDELPQSQIFNPTSPETTSQTTGTGGIDIRDFYGERYPDPSWKPSTPRKWTFQPCISCQTNSLLCDHALPDCTQCKKTDIKCSYRYLTNPPETKPIRFDEVPRTCFACFESNVRIQISGRCGPCDAKAGLKEKWKSDDASTATGATVPETTSASSTSRIEESKSELPRFLASLETRLEDIRLRHYSQPPPHQPKVESNIEGGAAREPQTQDLIQLPRVLPLETTSTPLPGFTTPCLACLDNPAPCSSHSQPTTHQPPPSIKPYRPLAIRSKVPTPTHSPSQSQLASAIPCLACFDDTVCAYHLKSGWEEKAATACGSCRFAGLECDELTPGCGACGERGVECLYIKGSAESVDKSASAPAPVPASEPEAEPEPAPIPPLVSSASAETESPPPPPRACGSCRLSETPCDETRPECLACKDKGLDCLYLSGGDPSPNSTSLDEPSKCCYF